MLLMANERSPEPFVNLLALLFTQSSLKPNPNYFEYSQREKGSKRMRALPHGRLRLLNRYRVEKQDLCSRLRRH
jgi:hypothetical protein